MKEYEWMMGAEDYSKDEGTEGTSDEIARTDGGGNRKRAK